MDTYSVITVAFLVFYLFAGVWAGRKTKTVEDHYVMSRSAPAFMITGTLVASNLSSVTFMSFTGTAYKLGPHSMISMFGMSVVASLVLGLWLGKYFYRMQLLTIPDFFKKRYSSRAVDLISSLIVLISMSVYMVAVMLGTTVVAENLFGWSRSASLIGILAAITIFTVIGGMRSVVVTDTIMFIVFLIGGLVIGPAIIIKLGGLGPAIEQATASIPHIFDWNGTQGTFVGGMKLLETNMLSFVMVLAAPHLISRINIAKSEREFSKAMIYLAVALPIVIVGLIYSFSYLPLLNSEIKPVDTFPWVARNLVPAFIGAIGLAGVIAAAISTTTSLFQQAAATLSSDIIKNFFKPDMDDAQLLKLSRFSVLLIAVLVFFGSSIDNIGSASIMYAFLFATSAFAAWLPSLYLGVLWKGATTKGALWSMGIGLPLIIALGLGKKFGVVPSWLPPNFFGLIVSTFIMVGVSLVTQNAEDEEIVYTNSNVVDSVQ